VKAGGGVVIGVDRQHGKLWMDAEETHCLIIGTTRSGKSRRLIVPTIWQLGLAGESMIISDMKGELYGFTSQLLREMDYEVIRLDFREPAKSRRWNPIDAVVKALKAGDMAKASQGAWDAAHIISYDPQLFSEKFWTFAQEALIAALILYVAIEAPPNARHMRTVFTMLVELGKDGGKEIDKLFDSLPLNHPARTAFGQSRLTTDKTRAGVFSGALGQIRLWSDVSIAWLTAGQDHDLAQAGTRPTAVYLVIPDERSTYDTLATLYVTQMYQALVDLCNVSPGRKLPVRVNLILDEFGNLPPFPDFCKKLTTAAGRNIRFTLTLQGLDQLEKLYLKDARTISGNCWTWVYLLTRDKMTAEVVAEMIGKYTIKTDSYSNSQQSQGYSTGMSAGLTQRYLVMPDEVMRWPAGVSCVLRTRMFPARLPLPDFSEYIDLPEAPEPEQEIITLPEAWLPVVPLPAAPVSPRAPKGVDREPDSGDHYLAL
jgi:type IV secretion system protein VirD4